MRCFLFFVIGLGALCVGSGCGGTTPAPAVTDELRQVCPGVSDSDLSQVLTGIQSDFKNGVSKADELSAANKGCQNDACVACVTAAIDLVYGN